MFRLKFLPYFRASFPVGLAFVSACGIARAATPETVFSIPAVDLSHHLRLDSRHQTVIWADPETGSITVQNLGDGALRAQLAIPGQIRQLVITPDGRWLYATHSKALDDPQPSRELSEVDLETSTQVREITLPGEPDVLAITSDRVALVSIPDPVGPRFLQLQLMDLKDGRLGGTSGFISEPLVLGPGETSVFARGIGNKVDRLNRQPFDPSNLTWSPTKTVTALGSFEASLGLPLAFSPDGRIAVGPLLQFANTPGEPGDLAKGTPLLSEARWSVLFSPGSTNFFLGTSYSPGLRVFRRDTGLPVGSLYHFQAYAVMPTLNRMIALTPGPDAAHYNLVRFDDPLAGLDSNQPPVARIAALSSTVTTAESVRFDASGSTDDLTPFEALQFRWDIDGDGAWDTAWTESPTFEYRLVVPGPRTVRVEVKDHAGATSIAELPVTVAFASIAATPISDPNPDVLPFAPVRVGFDIVHHRLYAADAAGGRLVRFNLTNGVNEVSWPLFGEVLGLAIQPDGRRLYLAESRPELNPIGLQTNVFLTEFNLETSERGSEIFLGYRVTDLVATDAGTILTAGESVRSYHWPDSKPMTQRPPGSLTRLMLHPNQTTAYGTSWDNPPGRYRRFQLDPVTGAILNDLSVPPNQGLLSLVAHGSNFVTGNSVLLQATPDGNSDFRLVPGITFAPEILSVVDLPANGLVGLRFWGRYEFYRPSDWQLVVTQPAPFGYTYLAADSTWLYELRGPANATQFQFERRHLPSADAAANRAPDVAWAGLNHRTLQAGQSLDLQVEASDRDGIITRVEYWANGTNLATILPPGPFPPIPGSHPELFPWTFRPTEPGLYHLTAVAVDNFGITAATTELLIRLNARPVLNVGALPPGNLSSPASFFLPVTATDPDGVVTRVELVYQSSAGRSPRVVGVREHPPFDFQVTGLSGVAGQLQVRAYDDTGAITIVNRTLPLIPPAGDDVRNPLTLIGDRATVHADLRQATADSSEISQSRLFVNCAAAYSWMWTAPGDRWVTVDTFGSSFDTQLQINRIQGGPETVVARNEDEPLQVPWSRVKFEARAGETFRVIAFSTADYDLGDLVLHLKADPYTPPEPANPPDNDRFANPTTLVENVEPLVGTTRGATNEGIPTDSILLGANSVWYQWTAPASGWAAVVTREITADTVVSVLPATGSGTLARSDDVSLGDGSSRLIFCAEAGTAYRIRVAAFAPREGDFRIQVQFPAVGPAIDPPINDSLGNAISLPSGFALVSGTTRGATADLPEGTKEVWWRWTAAQDATVHVALVPWSSGFSTRAPGLRIFTGESVETLTLVPSLLPSAASGGFTSVWRFAARLGVTYYMAADRVETDFDLTVNPDLSPAKLAAEIPASFSADSPTLRVTSSFARRVNLERSTDLLNWFPVQFYDVEPGTTEVNVPANSSFLREYWRISSYE